MRSMSYHEALPSSAAYADPPSPPGGVLGNATLFASSEFISALSRSLGDEHRPLALPVTGSGPPRTLHGSQTPGRYWTRYVSLAPFGLYASPGWTGHLERSTVEEIVRKLRGPRTRGFVWN